MTIQYIEEFLKKAQNALDDKFGKNSNQEVLVLSTMTKLTEEVGELAEQVMKWRGRQENRKGAYDPNELGSEVADVIFVVCMLAQSLDIDIEQALQTKMKKIKKKFEIEQCK